MRLVTLVAILRRAFARRSATTKAIVFISCADSVDFHFDILTRDASNLQQKTQDQKATAQDTKDGLQKVPKSLEPCTHGMTSLSSQSDKGIHAYRLHGSLPQHVRTSTLSAFTKSKDSAVLVCTDVASRGLDVPHVDFVVEYDPAFSEDDHLHRIGRTARAGKEGRALILLMPGVEEGYVALLKRSRRDGGMGVTRLDTEEILKRGFGSNNESDPQAKGWDIKATDWQLGLERWALDDPRHLEMARRAFQSHIRAYATHVAAERHLFNIKELHLGHLAKAFALRDKPGSLKVPGMRPGKEDAARENSARKARAGQSVQESRLPETVGHDIPSATQGEEAARKMKAAMKAAVPAVSEFNLG